MDTQYVGAGLVYHHTSPFLDHHSRPFPLLQTGQQAMAWQSQQSHTSPPNSSASTSSSLSSSSLYSTVTHPDERVDYPTASATLTQPRATGAYPSPSLDPGASGHGIAFDSPSIESSIGPSRILTRRRARGVSQSPMASRPYNRRPNSLSFASQQQRPRPPSPLRHPQPPAYPSLHSDLEAALGPAPYYFPSYSHSRSASGSISSSNPRSASPANSIASLASSRTSYSSNSTSQLHPANLTEPRQPKHRKQRLWSTDRKKICMCHRDNPGMKQEEIAAKFGVERSTVSKILKEKDRWLNVKDDEKMQVAKWRPTKFPHLEQLMRRWISETKSTGLVYTDAVIRAKAKEIAQKMGLGEDKFKASSGWVENFKARQGIKKGKHTGIGTDLAKARAFGCGFLPSGANPADWSAPPDPTLDVSTLSPPRLLAPLGDEDEEMHHRHDAQVPVQPAWQPQAEPPPPPGEEYIAPMDPVMPADPGHYMLPPPESGVHPAMYVPQELPYDTGLKDINEPPDVKTGEYFVRRLIKFAEANEDIIPIPQENVLREILGVFVRLSA